VAGGANRLPPFKNTRHPLDDLLETIHSSDYAILVVTADDITRSRGRRQFAPRDNVILELGMALGQLEDPRRTFIVTPRGVDLKIPSDITGLTRVMVKTPQNRSWSFLHRLRRSTPDMKEIVKPVVESVIDTIEALGSR